MEYNPFVIEFICAFTDRFVSMLKNERFTLTIYLRFVGIYYLILSYVWKNKYK